MTLSGIASLIVEDAHKNYILFDVQVSEWYHKYKDSVPSFYMEAIKQSFTAWIGKLRSVDITILENEG